MSAADDAIGVTGEARMLAVGAVPMHEAGTAAPQGGAGGGKTRERRCGTT